MTGLAADFWTAYAFSAGPDSGTGAEVTEELRQAPWLGTTLEPDKLLAGLIVALAGYAIARLVGWLLNRFLLSRRRGTSYAAIFGNIATWVITFIAAGIAATIAFPSINFANVFGGLGLSALIVSIAGQSIFSDVFAGVMMVVREPYREGDQVELSDVQGTIEEINLRETVVRTFQGTQVVIPNSTVYKSVVRVQTGYERRSAQVQVGVAYGTDLQEAKRLLTEVAQSVPQVLADPPPLVVVAELNPSSVQINVNVWVGSRQMEETTTMDYLIPEIIRVLGEHGIDMPPDTLRMEPSATPQA